VLYKILNIQSRCHFFCTNTGRASGHGHIQTPEPAVAGFLSRTGRTDLYDILGDRSIKEDLSIDTTLTICQFSLDNTFKVT
jgi:hypothetical protein